MIYQTLLLTWQNIAFTLAFDADYCAATGMAHIEIRCDRSLPITETGYKSIFIAKADIADIKVAAALILQHLERAAEQTNWKPHKQLSLF